MGYEISQQYLNGGDPKIVERTLGKLWRFARGGEATDWTSLSDQLIGLIRNEEDGPTFAHGVIDDALAATAYATRSALRADPQDALMSARRGYETVDRFGSLRFGATEFTDAIESAILENEVVQKELRQQMQDLLALDGAEDLGRVIDDLQERSIGVSALPLDEVTRQAVKAAEEGGRHHR